MKVALALSPRNLGEHIRGLLRDLEVAGLEEVWVTEELFDTSAPISAAFVLGATEHLRVGMGIMTTALRDPAVTALEIVNLEGFWPGRLIAGLGHGAARPLREVESPRAASAFADDLRKIGARVRDSSGSSPEILAAAGSTRSRERIRDHVDGFIVSWMTPLSLVQEIADWAIRQEPPVSVSLMSLFSLSHSREDAMDSSRHMVAGLLGNGRRASFESTRHAEEARAFEPGMQLSEALINDVSVTGDPLTVHARLKVLSEVNGLDRVILYPSSGTEMGLLVKELPQVVRALGES